MSLRSRENRSDIIHDTAQTYLEALAERDCIKAVALATEDGFLVAGTGHGYDLDWLAALGSVCGSRVERSEAIQSLIGEVTGGERFFSAALKVQGEVFYLASVGARIPRQMEAASVLDRILGPALEPAV